MYWSTITCITSSVHHALSHRFRSIPSEVVADAAMEAQYRFCRRFHASDGEPVPVEEGVAWRWMVTTAERILLRERQRLLMHVPLPEPDVAEEQAPRAQTGTSDPDQICNEEDSLTAALTVAALIGILSPLLAEVVQLHDLQGLSLEEVAQSLTCTHASIRQRHARALRSLRDFWKREDNRVGRCIDCEPETAFTHERSGENVAVMKYI